MFIGKMQPKNTLLIVGGGLLLLAVTLPSIFLLAKIAIGLIMTAIAAIAIKTA